MCINMLVQAELSLADVSQKHFNICSLMFMYNVNTHKHLCGALLTPVSQGRWGGCEEWYCNKHQERAADMQTAP